MIFLKKTSRFFANTILILLNNRIVSTRKIYMLAEHELCTLTTHAVTREAP